MLAGNRALSYLRIVLFAWSALKYASWALGQGG